MMIVYILLTMSLTALMLWAFFTAQRLNRLHIRTDSALQSLQAALDRRAAVVTAILPEAAALASAAESVPLNSTSFRARASVERSLTERISALESQLSSQAAVLLSDSTARVQLARRFYNDAVSDTRALRTRPLVRILRLGGTAQLPNYFELADSAGDV